MFSKLQYYIRQYFGFSRGQTYGVMVLLLWILVALTIPTVRHYYKVSQQKKQIAKQHTRLDQALKQLTTPQNIPKTQIVIHQTAKKDCFNINTATTTQLQTLYHIGPLRAKRIIAYRNSLGGFISKSQYNEIYNLPAEALTILETHTYINKHNPIKKINLNKASIHTLAQHPYLTYTQAKAIKAYQAQHGPFHNLQTLQKLIAIPPTTYKKLIPYLTLT